MQSSSIEWFRVAKGVEGWLRVVSPGWLEGSQRLGEDNLGRLEARVAMR
jgi:hypothetical protein